MSKVALVFPYFRTRSQTEMLFPPLGAATLLSQLRQRGIQARIFDCTFRTLAWLEQGLRSFQPEIVGVYAMITLSHNAQRIAQMTRPILPDSLLAAGGPLPTLYPQQYSPYFDAVFRGEADLSFPDFCRDVFMLGTPPYRLAELPLDSYAGLYIQAPGLQVDNPPVNYPERVIQSFPLPDRSDFDHAAYQKVWLESTGSKTASLITTLGCPFDCDFCSRPVFGSRFRRRDLEAVFEEIEGLRRLGYDSLWIADDNFTLNLAFVSQFCQRMAGRGLAWSCLSRSTGIDAQVARMMKEAGCQRVYLGLETGSQHTLELMNKRASLEDGVRAVQEFHQAGVEVAAFFIVGYPGETQASIESTFKLALDLPLDYISFNVPFPLPGSKLYERVSGVETDKDWDVENEVTFVYSSEFDPQELRRRIGETMQVFNDRKGTLGAS